MKKYFFVLIALFAVTFINAQSSKTYDLSDFTGIVISNYADVEFTQGSYSVVATGPQDLLDKLDLEVSKGSLEIKNLKGSKGQWNNKKPLVIKVSAPEIGGLVISGSGDFTFMNDVTVDKFAVTISGSGDVETKGTLNTGKFALVVSGSGDVELTGNAPSVSIAASGSGDVELSNFKCKEASIVNSGSAEIELYVSEKMSVVNSGSGDIEIDGSPEKKSIINTGSGDIDYKR